MNVNIPGRSETSVAKTAKDKDFVQQYYQKSRLHHISAWKNLFQEQLAREMACFASTQSNPEELISLSSDSPKDFGPVIFHVDMVSTFYFISSRLFLTCIISGLFFRFCCNENIPTSQR
jgi:hypothetical protein